MKINGINQTSFKGVNIVRVSKDVFHEDSEIDCAEQFNEIACDVLEKNGNYNFIDRINLKLQTRKGVKIYDTLESPGYDLTRQAMQKYGFGNFSTGWLAAHTKTNITLPESEDYYKFYVLTGEEKDAALREFNWLNTKKILLTASRIYEKTTDTTTNILREMAKASQIFDTIFKKIIKDKPIEEFEAKTPEELEEVLTVIYKSKD